MTTKPVTGQALAALFTAACIGAACGGTTRDGAIDEIRSAGYEVESAECIVTSVEDQGFAADQLLDDPIPNEIDHAIDAGVEACITTADIASVSDTTDSDDLRTTVIDDLVSGGMAPGEATCILREIEDAGFTTIDLATARLEGEPAGAAVDAVTAATEFCTADSLITPPDQPPGSGTTRR